MVSDDESCAPTEPEGDEVPEMLRAPKKQLQDDQDQHGARKMTAVKAVPAKRPAGVDAASVAGAAPLSSQLAELAELKAKYEALLEKVAAEQRHQSPHPERPLFTPSPTPKVPPPQPSVAKASAHPMAPEVVPVAPSPTCAPKISPAACPTSASVASAARGPTPSPTSGGDALKPGEEALVEQFDMNHEDFNFSS